MTKEILLNLIATLHRPDAERQSGMVYQVWEDGEVTLQKSGELLWQRTLHFMEGALDGRLLNNDMPIQHSHHSYMNVASKEDAETIRNAMREYFATIKTVEVELTTLPNA